MVIDNTNQFSDFNRNRAVEHSSVMRQLFSTFISDPLTQEYKNQWIREDANYKAYDV